MTDALTIVPVYPELLGTYGDRGNVLALVHRAEARGLAVRVVEVGLDDPLPVLGDLYVLGGGEDSAQLLAAQRLFADPGATRALGGAAPCFAVCAGLQLLAGTFEDAHGEYHRGLELLDVTCARLTQRAVGEIVTEAVDLPGVGQLSGFENHRGTAELGPSARPLGRVLTGVGNGDHRTEGVQEGNILATYLHGPALVRNPALADLLLARATGDPLPPYDHDAAERLHAQRVAAAVPHRRLRAVGSVPPRRGRRSGTP